jgi:cell division protein ZapA (FtsZ GTPase activity inhibitor)
LKGVEVQILGNKLKVSGDGGEEHVRKLVDYVNRRLDDLKGGSRNTQPQNLMMLGLLNVADEYFRFREEKEVQIEKVTGKVRRLIEIIDEGA